MWGVLSVFWEVTYSSHTQHCHILFSELIHFNSCTKDTDTCFLKCLDWLYIEILYLKKKVLECWGAEPRLKYSLSCFYLQLYNYKFLLVSTREEKFFTHLYPFPVSSLSSPTPTPLLLLPSSLPVSTDCSSNICVSFVSVSTFFFRPRQCTAGSEAFLL